MFLGKGVLKICIKFTGEHPCRSVISIKLLCNFIEIALRHGCSPVNLLHIFKTPFPKNTCRWLLLYFLPSQINLIILVLKIKHNFHNFRQIQKTSNLKSKQTCRTFTIFHLANYLSKYVIYLIEYKLCNEQYLGKAETNFNLDK